jgi:hypothetical protein
MQIGKAARSNGSHIKSRLKMEPHGVFKEVTKQCTNKDHYQSVTRIAPEWFDLSRVLHVHPTPFRPLIGLIHAALIPAVD